MRFERGHFGPNWIFQFPDMVSGVKYIRLNTEHDARAILKLFQEAEK